LEDGDLKLLCSLFLTALLALAGCRSTETMERVHVDVGNVPDSVRAEVTSLISQLKSESEVVFRGDEKAESTAINRLCKIGLPAVGQLVDSYYDSLPEKELLHFRYLIVDTLKRMKQPASLPFIMQVARYGDRRERRVACEAIWDFRDYKCVETLINALEDEDTEVVNTAAAGLRAITGHSFGPYLNRTAAQRKEEVRKWQHWWSVARDSYQARQSETGR
jgi:HEAT repeat protein